MLVKTVLKKGTQYSSVNVSSAKSFLKCLTDCNNDTLNKQFCPSTQHIYDDWRKTAVWYIDKYWHHLCVVEPSNLKDIISRHCQITERPLKMSGVPQKHVALQSYVTRHHTTEIGVAKQFFVCRVHVKTCSTVRHKVQSKSKSCVCFKLVFMFSLTLHSLSFT